MKTLHAEVYLKTRDPFLAYTPGDELARVTGPTGAPLLLTLRARTSNDVPQQVFDVGNHAGADVNGVTWPSDVRAVSVGDVIHITSPDAPTDTGRWLAVASRGFTRITPPGNVRPIVGSDADLRTRRPEDAGGFHRRSTPQPASAALDTPKGLTLTTTAPDALTRTVKIPGSADHAGTHLIAVTVPWYCPTCQGPRGEVHPAVSYDGSRQLTCDGWANPCGHTDLYAAVRREAGAFR